MQIDRDAKHQLKKDLKRRIITLLITVPIGIAFGLLFFFVGLSFPLQIFLTVVCWGASFVIIELIYIFISKQIAKRNVNKPKKRDPFAD